MGVSLRVHVHVACTYKEIVADNIDEAYQLKEHKFLKGEKTEEVRE